MRNVFFEVFEIESATYHLEEHGADPGYEQFKVVKTHLLPDQLPENLRSRKIVYLIRNGGDAAVSLAHHRKDIIDQSSDLRQNLREVIYAAEGSHFGGWSNHVQQWLPRADLVLHFEDFIMDPRGAFERIAQLMDIGEGQWDNLPSFDALKSGNPEYGSGKHLGKNLSEQWFRNGKVDSWRTEMSPDQQRLFWHLHGETMEFAGYESSERQYERSLDASVLIEAEKLTEKGFDGIKRYTYELLHYAEAFKLRRQNVKTWIGGSIVSIEDALQIEGIGKDSPSWIFLLVKNTLRSILPASLYSSLARRFPLSRVKRKFSGASTSSDRFDIVHVTLPQHWDFLNQVVRKHSVVTIHDMTHVSHPEYHLPNNVERTKEGIQKIKDTGAKCISVSMSTQKDATDSGLTSRLIYEGVDRSRFFPLNNPHLLSLVSERYKLPRRFILSVSTIEPRKNLQRLINAYAELDLKIREGTHLVIAGAKGWKSKLIVPEGFKSQIHFIGFVREDHISALYNLAHGFAYVSLYEGFGLPVLEAMACGTPVLVSDSSSLKELAGDVGLKCNPRDLASISSGLVELIESDKSLLLPRCMEHSWKFSWKDCWLQTADFYAQTSSSP